MFVLFLVMLFLPNVAQTNDGRSIKIYDWQEVNKILETEYKKCLEEKPADPGIPVAKLQSTFKVVWRNTESGNSPAQVLMDLVSVSSTATAQELAKQLKVDEQTALTVHTVAQEYRKRDRTNVASASPIETKWESCNQKLKLILGEILKGERNSEIRPSGTLPTQPTR